MDKTEKASKSEVSGEVENNSPEQQSLTHQEAIDLAVQHHTAGDLAKAESIYQKILQADPNHPDPLHLLGVIAHQKGDNDTAVDLITKALKFKPDYAEAHSNLGLALNGLGKLDEAVASYRKAITIEPDYAEAYYNLGLGLKGLGKLDEAVACYHKTIAINPDYVEVHNNLGNIFQGQGNLGEAVASYQKALAIKPDYAEAHGNLGLSLQALGKLDEAVVHYHKAIATNPDFAEAHYNLGNTFRDLEKPDEAVASYQKAVAIKPDYAEVHNNLGNVLQGLGKLDEAVGSYHRALSIEPDYAEAYSNLGNLLQGFGNMEEAVVCFNNALAIEPEFAEAHNNLGNTLLGLDKLDEAVASYRRALAIDPNSPEAYNNLGTALKDQGKFDEAVSCSQKALSIKVDSSETHNNLGTMLQSLGKQDEAMASYREALAIKPDNIEAGKNLLFAMYCVPGLSPEELFNESLRFSEKHTRDIILPAEELTNDPIPDRRLRVGYLSSDFRDHPVGRNILPLLTSYDRGTFEVFCYADVRRPDGITEKFRSSVDYWHTIVGKSDAEVAQMVRADGIDVLVCLAGRFDRNRPLVCAYRAAPVQVSYHDGATSGLKEMDYFLTDTFLNPPDTKEMFTEELHRLPVYQQYPPTEGVPPVTALPSAQAGFITFGSFNNPAKVNEEVIHLWAEVLKSVPGSRLLLKYKNWYSQASLHDSVVERFRSRGVSQDRLKFATSLDTIKEHLGRYSEVDIALDPFPFNGAETTFQALWMGVPVISMVGETFLSRGAGAILHHGGLGELVVDTPEAYVACAQDLAGNLARLEALRTNLRERIVTSPLHNTSPHIRSVETAYREMWRKWCVGQHPIT